MRDERAPSSATATEGADRRQAQLELLQSELAEAGDPGADANERLAALEAELSRLEGDREERLKDELTGLEGERAAAVTRLAELEGAARSLRAALDDALREAEAARRESHEAERAERRRAPQPPRPVPSLRP